MVRKHHFVSHPNTQSLLEEELNVIITIDILSYWARSRVVPGHKKFRCREESVDHDLDVR